MCAWKGRCRAPCTGLGAGDKETRRWKTVKRQTKKTKKNGKAHRSRETRPCIRQRGRSRGEEEVSGFGRRSRNGGNDPAEVEGGGTEQICFADAAPLCRGTNLLSGGLKVAAPVSSARVAPTGRRAHAVPALSSTARNRSAGQQREVMLGAGGTLAPSPHRTAEPSRAAHSPDPPLPRYSFSSSSWRSSSRASAGRHMLPAPSVAAHRVRDAPRSPPRAARTRPRPQPRAAVTRPRWAGPCACARAPPPRANGPGRGVAAAAALHVPPAVLRHPAPLCAAAYGGGFVRELDSSPLSAWALLNGPEA